MKGLAWVQVFSTNSTLSKTPCAYTEDMCCRGGVGGGVSPHVPMAPQPSMEEGRAGKALGLYLGQGFGLLALENPSEWGGVV